MKPSDIKIIGVTVTYNNEDKIPYVMPYYERMKIDKLIVYDNESTDNTVEMLSKYPFVEIRSYHTDKYSEDLVREFKQKVQDEFRGQYHWCISTYFDEVFYSERDFREVLYDKMCEGKTYFMKTGLNLFSRTFPPKDNGKLIHENIGRGSLWTADDDVIGIYGNKTELFDMTKLYVTYNENGCHQCALSGIKSPFEDEISFFHIKFIDFNFIVESSKLYSKRTEGTDIACYDYFVDNMEKVYGMMEKKAISVETYMKSSMKELVPEQVIFVIKETDVNEQKKCLDKLYDGLMKGIYRQCTILFYGKSDCGQESWYYAMDKYHLFIFVNTSTDDPIEAVRGYGFRFEKEIIDNPWIIELNKEQLSDENLFTITEHNLKNFALSCAQEAKIEGYNFVRYQRYISSRSSSTLGCYMIVKNEESTIGKCLDSIINICDEIVVVDTGCDDRTMDIVKSYGSKISTYKFDWINDFSAARNFAMGKITTDYAFTTDADEVFSPNLQKTVMKMKNNGFYGRDWIDIWLLNYNGTENYGRYLAGRQIVSTKKHHQWKYRIHEKLYGDDTSFNTIDFNDGYILHKHKGNTESVSNYNKYAEIYFEELNKMHGIPKDGYSVHFYYYMFLTLNGIDSFTAKKYLYNAYDRSKIVVPNEDIRKHLLRDGYISFEEMTAFELINSEKDTMFIGDISSQFIEPFARYILQWYVFNYGKPGDLSREEMTDLAYNSYMNGLVHDFSSVVAASEKIYAPDTSTMHNSKFIRTYIAPFEDKTLVVLDTSNGKEHFNSISYYLSKMFIHITDSENFNKEKGKYENIFLVDCSKPLSPKTALGEFENVMYGRESNVLKKINGGC